MVLPVLSLLLPGNETSKIRFKTRTITIAVIIIIIIIIIIITITITITIIIIIIAIIMRIKINKNVKSRVNWWAKAVFSCSSLYKDISCLLKKG